MRLIAVLIWMLWFFISGLSFAVFSWTAVNVPPPVNDPSFPLPGWWWTASMATIAILMLVGFYVGIVRMLDQLRKD